MERVFATPLCHVLQKHCVFPERKMDHLCPQHVRTAAEAYRKTRVVGAQSFLLDSDNSHVKRVRLSVLAL